MPAAISGATLGNTGTPTAVAAAPPKPAPAEIRPAAPPKVELPSSEAAYLQNPKPAYPLMSKRLGEQGKVIVRVYIGADGIPQRAEIGKSSGYDRLDQAAISSVMRWKFVPGKRNGVAEAMWNNVPQSDQQARVLNTATQQTVPWAMENTPMPMSGDHAEHMNHGAMHAGPAAPTIRLQQVVDLASARKVEPGYSITFPTTATGVFTVAVFANDPRNDATLHVDQYTGKVLADVRWEHYNWVARTTETGVMLHEGKMFGWVNQLIVLVICLMILLMGLGLGSVFVRFPVLYTVLRYVGGTYMLYLAWKIFRSQPAAPTDGHAAVAKPMGFIAAAAFQWVNPKVWVMALGSITTYLPAQHTPWQLLGLVGLMGVINMPTTSTWALFGSSMRRHLQEPRFLRIFNTAAALALVASLYPLLTSP